MSIFFQTVLWLALTLAFCILYFIIKKQMFNLKELLNIAFSSGALVISISLFFQLVFSQNLREMLEKEVGFNITVFYVGIFASAWLSLQPIAQLFQPNSFIGRVEDYKISTTSTISLTLRCRNRIRYRVVLAEDILNQRISSIGQNANLQRLQQNHDYLIGREISILDVSPIIIGSGKVSELRVNLPEQLIIN